MYSGNLMTENYSNRIRVYFQYLAQLLKHDQDVMSSTNKIMYEKGNG